MDEDWKELVRHVTPSGKTVSLNISMQDIVDYMGKYNIDNFELTRDQWEKWLKSKPDRNEEFMTSIEEVIFEFMIQWLYENTELNKPEKKTTPYAKKDAFLEALSAPFDKKMKHYSNDGFRGYTTPKRVKDWRGNWKYK